MRHHVVFDSLYWPTAWYGTGAGQLIDPPQQVAQLRQQYETYSRTDTGGRVRPENRACRVLRGGAMGTHIMEYLSAPKGLIDLTHRTLLRRQQGDGEWVEPGTSSRRYVSCSGRPSRSSRRIGGRWAPTMLHIYFRSPMARCSLDRIPDAFIPDLRCRDARDVGVASRRNYSATYQRSQENLAVVSIAFAVRRRRRLLS